MERNPVNWFEVPVEEMDRAIEFYETVFGYSLDLQDGYPEMAWFPMQEDLPGSAGTLIHMSEMYETGGKGVLIYFTSPSGDLQNELGRVDKAGGEVVIEKRDIGEHGFIAVFKDSEGNRVALHSQS